MYITHTLVLKNGYEIKKQKSACVRNPYKSIVVYYRWLYVVKKRDGMQEMRE